MGRHKKENKGGLVSP